MTVVHFVRKKRPHANFSIEGLYKSIREELKDKVNIKVIECLFQRGFEFGERFDLIKIAKDYDAVYNVCGKKV